MAEAKGSGSECDAIRDLIRKATDLPEDVSRDCMWAIEHLQWTFDRCGTSEPDASREYMAFTWPLLINKGYLELLSQRRPEALIIFAYYGVMLHHHRTMWLVGRAGQHIISLITQYLAPEWQPWLVWPNQVTESNTRPSRHNSNA